MISASSVRLVRISAVSGSSKAAVDSPAVKTIRDSRESQFDPVLTDIFVGVMEG
jgi:hypothetical protein